MTMLCVCYGITISVKVLWMVYQSAHCMHVIKYNLIPNTAMTRLISSMLQNNKQEM